MKLRPSKGRMFSSVDYTGTYYQGCDHGCLICWTRWMWGGPISHEPRLMQTDEYELLDEREAVIFLNSAHDSLAECNPTEWILAMLRWIGRQHPSLEFYIQSQNPERALTQPILHALEQVKPRVILGTTIQTNRQDIIDSFSKAPPIIRRVYAMLRLGALGFRLRLSLEPLYAFDYLDLRDLVISIGPELVEVGLDNYGHRHKLNIPQPNLSDYLCLKEDLEEVGIRVNEKKSIRKWRRKI